MHATEWEKTLIKHTSDKELIFKTYKNLIQLNRKKKPSNQFF